MRKAVLVVLVLLLVAAAVVPLWLAAQVRAIRSWDRWTDRLAPRRPAVEAVVEGVPERGWLGVETLPLTPELRRHFGVPAGAGVLVAAVIPGSPAWAAGIEAGDVLTRLGGDVVGSPAALTRRVGELAERTVGAELTRDGVRRELEVELGRRGGLGELRVAMLRQWRGLGERIRAVGERYGVLDEGRRPGAVPPPPASAAPATHEELERRIAELEARLRQLEATP